MLVDIPPTWHGDPRDLPVEDFSWWMEWTWDVTDQENFNTFAVNLTGPESWGSWEKSNNNPSLHLRCASFGQLSRYEVYKGALLFFSTVLCKRWSSKQRCDVDLAHHQQAAMLEPPTQYYGICSVPFNELPLPLRRPHQQRTILWENHCLLHSNLGSSGTVRIST